MASFKKKIALFINRKKITILFTVYKTYNVTPGKHRSVDSGYLQFFCVLLFAALRTTFIVLI